jgi:2-desacetyl-2-hydroxyethyl bacteriochlorophyllide A dehydrogenase
MPTARQLFFSNPRQLELREIPLRPIAEHEVLVKSICSSISAGTEMLIYRGQFASIPDQYDSISSDLQYPLTYGYACVGRIIEAGGRIDKSWLDRLVFSFHPHTTHFIARIEEIYPLPSTIAPEAACFLPNMETAVNLVHDGNPILGERVLVLGQGTIGLLVAALLAEFPLDCLITADLHRLRREASSRLNVTACLDPASVRFRQDLLSSTSSKFDLSIELSGSSEALNHALALTRFSGRIIIGSWYGKDKCEVDLGGAFHRSRIKMIASQVSTIAPELSQRWDKARRFDLTWKALKRIQPQRWITHRFNFEEAPRAYELIDREPHKVIQVLLEYTG